MKLNLIIVVVLTLAIYACQKPNLNTILFDNSFENQTELNEFILNKGEINLSHSDALDSKACLHIYCQCQTPNLYQEFGPFEKDYYIHMESWIKTEISAVLHLNLKNDNRAQVRIEVENPNVNEAPKWEKYTSEKLFVPQGESVMLYIDASNSRKAHSYFDDIRLIGSEEG